MRIAYMGTMGIPARYGGSETCVEEVATRLARKGHEVTVYCGYRDSKPQDKIIQRCPTSYLFRVLETNFMDFPFRSFVSTLMYWTKTLTLVHFFGSDAWTFYALTRDNILKNRCFS